MTSEGKAVNRLPADGDEAPKRCRFDGITF
jgi:hypothetical protein